MTLSCWRGVQPTQRFNCAFSQRSLVRISCAPWIATETSYHPYSRFCKHSPTVCRASSYVMSTLFQFYCDLKISYQFWRPWFVFNGPPEWAHADFYTNKSPQFSTGIRWGLLWSVSPWGLFASTVGLSLWTILQIVILYVMHCGVIYITSDYPLFEGAMQIHNVAAVKLWNCQAPKFKRDHVALGIFWTQTRISRLWST